jgi:hypothetical protein
VDSTFSSADLDALTDAVASAWAAGAQSDWSARAGTLAWSCLHTADHAVDTVMAPALFLASRRTDAYPDTPWSFEMGAEATPTRLVEGLRTATRILQGVVVGAEPDVRAIIWRRPVAETRPPADFLPRAGLELALHGHDVCLGLGVPFEPPAVVALHLREHTRAWPMWQFWQEPGATDDPWHDLLVAAGRARAQ